MGLLKSSEERQQRATERTEAAHKEAERRKAELRADGKFFEFTGYTDNYLRPAVITVYQDRIVKVTKAPASNLILKADQGVEEVLLKNVTSVETKRESWIHTRLYVYASPNSISLRFETLQAPTVREDLKAGIAEAMQSATSALPGTSPNRTLSEASVSPARGMGPSGGGFGQQHGTALWPVMGPPVWPLMGPSSRQ